MQPAQYGVALSVSALVAIMAMQNGQPPAIAFAVGAVAFGLVIGVLGQGAAPAPAPAPVAVAAPRAQKAQKAPRKAAAPSRKPEPVPEPEPEPAAAKKKKKKKPAAAAAPAPVSPPPTLESESSKKSGNKKKSGKSAAASPAAAAPAAAAAAPSKAPAAAKASEAPLSKSALKRQKLKAAAAKKEPTNILLATNSAVAAAVDNDDGWEVQASRKPRKTKAPAVEQTTMPEEENGPPKVDLQLEIPSKFYGTLIGSKGATLNLIQEGTGCRIDIPKKDEGEIVKITGSTEGIQRAKATIESLIKTGFSPITHPGMSKNEISVEEKLRPRLVGKKAQNLHALQDATNTVINLPQQGKGNKVSIIGTPQDIAQCKALIKQLLTDGYCPATHPGYMKVEMPFPRDRFGILIGPNGGTIKHITNSTGCQLNIPNATDLNQNLTLVGTAEGISQAQKHIKAVLEKEEAAKAAQRASLEEEEEYWKVDESALLDVW